ncbi:sugar transporter [Powellomyces hirtus]|nr:sugar transporter [Powellomyces hirtus]
MQFPKVYNTYFLAFVSTIGGMLFGFDISSMSAIVGTKQYADFFDNPSDFVQGAIGAALAGGSVIGSLMAGPMSDKWGRRDSIFMACIFWVVGTIIQIFVTGVPTLIIGRAINGICVGITSSQVPVYLAEIAKKEKRGSIIVIQQLAIEWGILIMFGIGLGCKHIEGTASFRIAWGTQLIPAVFLMVGLPFLPKSPRWLAKVGRTEEAIDTLARIQANGNKNDPLVVAEFESIATVLAAERTAVSGWRRYIKNGMWRRTFAGLSVQAWQQLSGANIMMYYVVYVFSMAGIKGNANDIASLVQYVILIIFSTAVFFFIDKTGRRPLLIYGALGMALCLFVVGGILSKGTHVPGGVDGNPNVVLTVSGASSGIIIGFCYLLVAIYATTLAPVAWVYAAEVWSLETRATGMSLAANANWIFNFLLGLFVPPMLKAISWWTFVIFGMFCVGAAIQAFVSYPETAGKSLEEIEKLFSDDAPRPWHTKPGNSLLDAKIDEIAHGHDQVQADGFKQDVNKMESTRTLH